MEKSLIQLKIQTTKECLTFRYSFYVQNKNCMIAAVGFDPNKIFYCSKWSQIIMVLNKTFPFNGSKCLPNSDKNKDQSVMLYGSDLKVTLSCDLANTAVAVSSNSSGNKSYKILCRRVFCE